MDVLPHTLDWGQFNVVIEILVLVASVLIIGATFGKVVLHRYRGHLREVVQGWQNRVDRLEHEVSLGLILLNELKFAQKVEEFSSSRAVRDLLDRLEETASDHMEVGYTFSQAIKSIAVVIRPAKSTTVVCTVATGEAYRATVTPCVESHKLYAQRHGFAHAIILDNPASSRPAPWLKVALIAKLLLAGYERIIYVDADALITNKEREFASAIEDLEIAGRSLLLTEDEGGLNTGVIFARRTSKTLCILELVWLFDADVDNATWEQFALKYLVGRYPAMLSHIEIEPNPRKFNSFPVDRRIFYQTREEQLWSPGDFLCHFSGIRSPHLERVVGVYDRYTNRSPLPDRLDA